MDNTTASEVGLSKPYPGGANDILNYEEAAKIVFSCAMPTCMALGDGTIEKVNPQWLKTFGFDDANDVIGDTFRVIQGPSTSRKTLDRLFQACVDRTVFEGKILNYTRRGSPLWNQLKIEPVSRDRFLVYSTSITDIASVSLLRDLTYYEEEERMMHNAMNSNVPTCLMDGKVVLDANIKWCNTFRIGSKKSIVNKTTRLLQGPMTEANIVKRLMETLLVEKKIFTGTLTNYTMDDCHVPFFNTLRIQPLKNNYFISQTIKAQRITDLFPNFACVLLKGNKIISANQTLLDLCEINDEQDIIGYSYSVVTSVDFDLFDVVKDCSNGQIIVRPTFLCTKGGMLIEVQSRICKFGNDHILIVSSGDKKPYYIKKAQTYVRKRSFD